MTTRWMQWAIKRYLPDILTGMGMAGVAVTGYLGVEAGKKGATDTIAQGNDDWKNYIPPVISGVMSAGCIFGAHKAHLHKEAALAAVAALWSGKYRDLDRKARELLGEERYHELKQLVGMDEMKKAGRELPPWESAEEGKTTYYEPYSGQYFQATAQEMLYAQLHVNKVFQEYGGVTLNDYLNILPGCHRVDIGKDIGWYQGTDCWEETWGFFTQDIGHFIDMTFADISKQEGAKIILYNVDPSIPDDDWEPWK